jgi:hypothetical protein
VTPIGRGLVIVLGVAAIYGGYSWITAPLPLSRAIADGKITAVVGFGGAGSPSTITVTRTPGTSGAMTVRVPAGTVLYAGNAATQRLMTAATVTIVLPAGSEGITTSVHTYCLDEFAAVPDLTTALAFVPGPGDRTATTEETEPLHKLAECMAGKAASEEDKQLAVWAVKDDLLHKSPQDALDFLARGLEEQVTRELRAKVERARASIAQEVKHLSAADLDAQIAETVQAEQAANRRRGEQLARNQLDHLRRDRDLLTSCGYAADDLPLFR